MELKWSFCPFWCLMTPVPTRLHCMKKKSLYFLLNFCISQIFQSTCKHDEVACFLLPASFFFIAFCQIYWTIKLNFLLCFHFMFSSFTFDLLSMRPFWVLHGRECIGFYGDHHLTGPGAVSQQVILERESCCLFHMLNVDHILHRALLGMTLFIMFPIAMELAKALEVNSH